MTVIWLIVFFCLHSYKFILIIIIKVTLDKCVQQTLKYNLSHSDATIAIDYLVTLWRALCLTIKSKFNQIILLRSFLFDKLVLFRTYKFRIKMQRIFTYLLSWLNYWHLRWSPDTNFYLHWQYTEIKYKTKGLQLRKL